MQKFCTALMVVFLAVPAAFADLEVYLPLDGNLNDASGNGRNGFLTDGSFGTHGYVVGQEGQGLDLGLVDESYDILKTTTMNGDFVGVNYVLPDSGAIACWYKYFSLDYNYQSVWDNSGTSTAPADNWECYFTKRSELFARASDGEDGRWDDVYNRSTFYRLDEHYNPYLEQWFHIVVTWDRLDATTMEFDMYVNGELVPNVEEAGTIVTNGTCYAMPWQDPGTTFYLGGGHDDNRYGVGVWDEVAIWSNRLDATQVSNVYNDGVTAWDQVGMPGDLNDDGYVNSADLDIVRSAWGASVTGGAAAGDPTEDGVVNSADLDIIRANWGRTASASAVPEPATLLLALCGFGVVLLRRTR